MLTSFDANLDRVVKSRPKLRNLSGFKKSTKMMRNFLLKRWQVFFYFFCSTLWFYVLSGEQNKGAKWMSLSVLVKY